MDPNAQPQPPGTVILVDKPLTWTSFDIVKKLRYHLKVKKIGHAGTLDPLATGLLILCTGRMTKQIEKYQAQEKEYTGKFVIGCTTPSFDLETEPENHKSYDHIKETDIYEAAKKLTGVIDQVPPIFSAIKVDGKRAYKSAREGEEIQLKSRSVEVKDFEIIGIALPKISFRIVCSKGTYIRSLARDIGELLGVGAYLAELRRTRIGEFDISQAKTIEELTDK
jgi:tRNA pseudouridine55 synthase